jgi:hypothetical protein
VGFSSGFGVLDLDLWPLLGVEHSAFNLKESSSSILGWKDEWICLDKTH